jgi:hypothetical protein
MQPKSETKGSVVILPTMQSKQKTIKTHMKRKSLSIIIATMMGFALVPAASAQTVDGSVLYTPNVDLSSLTQNTSSSLYVGGIFLTTSGLPQGPQVNYLGYADPTGSPLVNSHVVSLWDSGYQGSTAGLVASVTVPAGNAAPLINGYRWVQLPSTVTLVQNEYYFVYGFVDGVDLWGDNISGSQLTYSSQYVFTDPGYDFSRQGTYSGTEPANNQAGPSDGIYPAANLGYNVVPTPEPTTLALLGMGTALLFGMTRPQKN